MQTYAISFFKWRLFGPERDNVILYLLYLLEKRGFSAIGLNEINEIFYELKNQRDGGMENCCSRIKQRESGMRLLISCDARYYFHKVKRSNLRSFIPRSKVRYI